MSATYLAFDCETGGIDPKEHSLLTLHFRVLDENFKELSNMDIFTMPNDGVFKCTHGALNINGIDLVDHAEAAIPYKAASNHVRMFIEHNKGTDKLIPLGHNVAFDIGFIQEHLISKKDWEKLVSYRVLDTAIVANFLKAVGIIHSDQKTSLWSLAEYYNLDPFNHHEAGADVEATINLLLKMKESINVRRGLEIS